MVPYRSPKDVPGSEPPAGEVLSLERAEEVARELGIHPQGIRRLMARALRAEWYAGDRKLLFTFPADATDPPPTHD